MRILLIGASGCFGTELINYLRENHKSIIIKFFPSKLLNVINIKNLESKINQIKPTVVINSSAIVGINQCENLYEKAFAINTIGALNLAKICKQKNIILVQTSTHAVFDGTNNSFYNEKSNQNQTMFIVEQNFCQKFLLNQYVKNIML